MFQKDYWALKDEELEKLAKHHNIPPISRTGKEGEHWYIDRDRIINTLVARDNALRANVAVISALVSLLATAVNLYLTFTGRK